MTRAQPPADDRGRSATSPWQMPASGWRDILLRTWKEASEDNIGLIAAGVAFYAFLAIVPMLGATVLTYGLVASPRSVLANMASLTRILPADIAGVIGDQLMTVVHSSKGKKGVGVLAALAVALFGARNGAGSIIIALNIAYEEEEKRGFVKVTLLALAVTAAAVALALFGVAAIGVLQFIGRLLPQAPAVALVGKIVTPLLLGAGAAGAAAALYRYGPSRDKAKWRWITPGSVFSAVAWLAATGLFGLYLTRFAHYDATYGSVGGVVALLTWTYLSAYVFLFGAELNSEIEHQTARDSTQGPDRALGARGAWMADHVAVGPDDAGEARAQPPVADEAREPPPQLPKQHPYVASVLTGRGARLAGMAKVGTLSSVLATAGLSLLRQRGRARAGVALLGAAVGLALLRRDPPKSAGPDCSK